MSPHLPVLMLDLNVLRKRFRTTQVSFSWLLWSFRIVKRKYPFLGSGSYLMLLWNKVLGLFGNNNDLNFPLTEPWWNLEELLFWHKLLPKCCLHPLLRLVWNETVCGRRPSSIRTSWELCWSLELMITLHSDADLYTDFHFSFFKQQNCVMPLIPDLNTCYFLAEFSVGLQQFCTSFWTSFLL